MAKGKKTGGRQKGTINKKSQDLQAKLAHLKCDPVAILAHIATRQIPCGTCIDRRQRPTGKTHYRLPEGSHAAGCKAKIDAPDIPCTCAGIGERVCESCFGTKWERISVQDMGNAAGRLAKMVVPELKAIEMSGQVDIGLGQAAAIIAARKARMGSE
jgi:hypothetical protein